MANGQPSTDSDLAGRARRGAARSSVAGARGGVRVCFFEPVPHAARRPNVVPSPAPLPESLAEALPARVWDP